MEGRTEGREEGRKELKNNSNPGEHRNQREGREGQSMEIIHGRGEKSNRKKNAMYIYINENSIYK